MKIIFINYLYGWFLLDLICSFPVSFLSIKWLTYSKFVRISKIAKLIRYFKIIRFFKIIKFFKSPSLNNSNIVVKSPALKRITKTVLICLILIHIITCIWYFIAILIDHDDWINFNNFNNKKIYEKYLMSLYWSVQTIFTVGYGDTTGMNIYEKILTIMVIYLGVIIYSLLVSSISSFMRSINIIFEEQNFFFQTLNNILKHYKIKDVNKKIIEKSIKMNENKLLKDVTKDLSKNLKTDLYYSIHYKNIENLNFFIGKSKHFCNDFLLNMELKIYKKNYFIFEKLNPANQIFLLKSGSVGIYTKINKTNWKLFTIKKGEIFGDWDIYFNNNIRRFYGKIKENSEIYIIESDKFVQLLYDKYIFEKNQIFEKSLFLYKLLINEERKMKRKKNVSKSMRLIKNLNHDNLIMKTIENLIINKKLNNENHKEKILINRIIRLDKNIKKFINKCEIKVECFKIDKQTQTNLSYLQIKMLINTIS